MRQSYLVSLFLLSHLLPASLSAQEWKYTGPKVLSTFARVSWIDAAGNSYHNVTESNQGSIEENTLLILDKNGAFNGRIKVNNCQSTALLYPYQDDHYLASDFNCNEEGLGLKDSRVFDHQGNLALTGDPFSLHQFASIRGKDGYTVFTQRGFSENKPLLGLRHIDWDFNIEDASVDLKSLARPNFQMMADISRLPVQTKDGNWVVVLNYGEEHEKGITLTPTQSFLVLTNGKSILKRFNFDLNNEQVEAIQAIGDQIVVLTNNGGIRLKKKIYLLNNKLNIENKFVLNMMGHFDAFLAIPSGILILEKRYEQQRRVNGQYYLSQFDWKGNFVKERHLQDADINTNSFLPFGENSVLLSGSLQVNDKQVCFVWKLDLSMDQRAEQQPEPAPIVTKEPLEESPQNPIADMTVENLSREALSVAVFPNPASIYINFALKNREAGQHHFLLKVSNMEGKTVHQASFQDSAYELDISQFPPGTYAYQIINQSDKKDFMVGKFVKVR